MAISGRTGRLRSAVPIVLLIMILMRLVWMQLRSYPSQADTRALMSLETLINRPLSSGCDTSRSSYRLGLAPQPLVPAPAATPPPGPAVFSRLAPSPPSGLAAARAYLASPGYVALADAACRWDVLDDRWALKANQWLFVMTVLCTALMTRMITSSWTIALSAATVVFSRGRLLADIGLIAPDYLVMFWLTAGLMAATHVLRSGARFAFAAVAAAFFVGALFERSLVVLFWLFPTLFVAGALARSALTRPLIRRLRGSNRRLRALHRAKRPSPASLALDGGPGGEPGALFVRLTHSIRDVLGLEFPEPAPASWRLNYARGSLFRTLSLPFMLWIFWQRRWLRLSLVWLLLAVAAVAVLVALQQQLGGGNDLQVGRLWQQPGPAWTSPFWPWLVALARPLDLHLAVSLGVLVVCALQSPAWGLPSFFEWSWLLLLTMLLLLVATYVADSADFALVHQLVERGASETALLHLLPRRLLLWLEPTILSCGVAGLYNLMKVLDTRIGGNG